MKTIKRLGRATAFSALALPAFASEEVKIGVPSWPGAQAIAHVLGEIVTSRIGGKVEYVPGNNAAIFQAMDQGKGTVTLSSNPYEGNQGLCVSKDFATRLNVTDITDLGRPEVAAAMDSDGNGKGEGFAFYRYEPHAIWFMFDVVMLNEPPFDPAKYIMVQPADDPDWYAKSTVATKDSIKEVQIAWSNSLADRSPTIADFFSNFSVTAEDVSQMAYEMTANGLPPEDAARAWVAANTDRVDAMLGL